MTAPSHATRYRYARATTLTYLMEKERKTPEFYTDTTLNSMLVAAVAKALAGFTREQALRGDA